MGAYLNLIGWGGGRLFEVGANSRLGAYSNKYGSKAFFPFRQYKLCRGLQGDSLVLHNTSPTARLLYSTMITLLLFLELFSLLIIPREVVPTEERAPGFNGWTGDC